MNIKKMKKDCLTCNAVGKITWSDGKIVKCPDCMDGVSISAIYCEDKKERDVKTKLKEMEKEIKNFRETGIPRCYFCKKEFVKLSKHAWKPNCEHNKSLRLNIG